MDIDWHLCEDDFFHGLPLEKKDFMLLARKRTIPRKEYLFREGEEATTCYYLQTGHVRIIRSSPSGKEPMYFLRKAGELFGLAEIVGSRERRASAQAVSRCAVYEISCDSFDKLLSHHPSMAKRVIGVLGRRIRYLGEQIEILMCDDVTTRVLKTLFYFSCHTCADEKGAARMVLAPVRLTQEQLGDCAGACQQTISDSLKRLREDGLIRIEDRAISLIQGEELLRRMNLCS